MVLFVSAALLGAIKGTRGQGDAVACLSERWEEKRSKLHLPSCFFTWANDWIELDCRWLIRASNMHAREDAEKMIFYRYNHIIFQSNNISLTLQGKNANAISHHHITKLVWASFFCKTKGDLKNSFVFRMQLSKKDAKTSEKYY